ncbi:MAG TPA: cytochrome c biogenesis protein CcsA [Myxococcales bacterium]
MKSTKVRQSKAPLALVAFGVALLCVGSFWGLAKAPSEVYMGDVQRIMYVHVPTAWIALLCLAAAFASAVGFLTTRRWKLDALLEASVEVGVVLSFLLCVQGAIWAKPTWGVWWDWDPRLTTTAVMVFAFGAILALRAFVEDPVRRAVWSAVACIVAFADVPIVYYSVKWWNSLHQAQSSPATVSSAFYAPLRINAFGILFLWIGLVWLRSRMAALRLRAELAPPPPAKSRPVGAAVGEAS